VRDTPPWSEIWLSYGLKREIRFRAGRGASTELSALAEQYFDNRGVLREDRCWIFHTFLNAIRGATAMRCAATDDVMAYVAECQDDAHRRAVVDERLPEGIEIRSLTPCSRWTSTPTSGKGRSLPSGQDAACSATTWGWGRPSRPSPPSN